ncbi:MAG: hypothetical protein AB7N80_01810 [Bdellovibrionales bacterium]
MTACADYDPHKRLDENASQKRDIEIQQQLILGDQQYTQALTLENKALQLEAETGGDLVDTVRIEARQKLDESRSTYLSILRRVDLEHTSKVYDRYQIEQRVLDIDTRLRQLNQPRHNEGPPLNSKITQ